MLEQAVYAGRNHALSLAAAVLGLFGMAAPAHAEDVARVSLVAGSGERAPQQRERTFDAPATRAYRLSKTWVNRIARAGERPRIAIVVDAVDREGHAVSVGGGELRVRR